jgi:hypothetical protein
MILPGGRRVEPIDLCGWAASHGDNRAIATALNCRDGADILAAGSALPPRSSSARAPSNMIILAYQTLATTRRVGRNSAPLPYVPH